MKNNPYWQMAKMAFVLGAASAAGGLVISTGFKLAQKAANSLAGLSEDDAEEVQTEIRAERESKET